MEEEEEKVERKMKEIALLEDMCEKTSYGHQNLDQVYFDENTWDALDPKLVRQAEAEEMTRFRKQGVYSYHERWEALQDKEGQFVKVKWVRINKGT